MNRQRKSLRNLEIVRVDSRPLDDDGFGGGGGGRAGGGFMSKFMPGGAKQKSYESLLDVSSPTEERPRRSGGGNLIDFAAPTPPTAPPAAAAAFPTKPAPPPTKPMVIRGAAGGGGVHNKFGSVDCLSARYNPSFRKESPKAKAAASGASAADSHQSPDSGISESYGGGDYQQLQQQHEQPQPHQRRAGSAAAAAAATSAQKQQPRVARSLYAYDSQHAGDLSFAANQIISGVQRVDADWLRGSLHGRSGMFPANFVQLVDQQPPAKAAKPKPPGSQQQQQQPSGLYWATAMHDYASTEPGDLAFAAGERIRILEEIANSEWLRGAVGDRSGIFPRNFVQKEQQPQQQQQQAKALHDFAGREADELTFSAGDVIADVSEVNADWLAGRLGAARGIFPKSFVQLL